MKALVLTTALALLPGIAAAQQIAGVTSDDQIIYLSIQNGYQVCELEDQGEAYALTECKKLKTPEPSGMAALSAALAGVPAPADGGASKVSVDSAESYAAYMKETVGCRISEDDAMESLDATGMTEEDLGGYLNELHEAGKVEQVGEYVMLKIAGCV